MKNRYENLTREQLISMLSDRERTIEELMEKQRRAEEEASLLIARIGQLKILAPDEDLSQAESQIAKLRVMVGHLIEKYQKKVGQYAAQAKEIYGKKSERNVSVARHEPRKRRKGAYDSFIADLKSMQDVIEHRVTDVDFEVFRLDRNKYERAEGDMTLKLEGMPVEIRPVIEETAKYRLRKDIGPDESLPQIVSVIREDPYHNSLATPSLLATLAMCKFVYGVPLYRIAEHCSVMGVPLKPKTVDQMFQRAMESLSPMADTILERVRKASRPILHADETTLAVLESGRSKGYVYQLAASRFDAPANYFVYTGTRSSDAIRDMLPKDRKTVICCDGFSGYEKLKRDNPDLYEIQACNFHARKKFVEANEALDEKDRRDSMSGRVIDAYSLLFAEEERLATMTPEGRKKERRGPSYRVLVRKLRDTVHSIDAPEGTLLWEAKKYFEDREDDLFRYLSDGYLDMTNNRAERNFKTFVMSRRNFLVCRTEESARRLTDGFSVVSTAMEYGIDLFSYLTEVFSKIADPNADIESLMPWDEEIIKRHGLRYKKIEEK